MDINDVDTNRVVSITRITVADGYRSYAANDGYLNPMIEEISGEAITISNGKLTSQSLRMGPLVFPYTVPLTINGVSPISGGFDPKLLQPSIFNNNLQVFIQIKGTSLAPQGNFFEIKDIEIDNMSNISYNVLLSSFVGVVI